MRNSQKIRLKSFQKDLTTFLGWGALETSSLEPDEFEDHEYKNGKSLTDEEIDDINSRYADLMIGFQKREIN